MMIERINIKSLCEYAMFETDGEVLRTAIEEIWNNDPTSTIILDFSDVDMYATMFFNASIGWLVLHHGEDTVRTHIITENMTKLGADTWKHSFENAITVANDPQYKKILSELDTTIDD